MITPKPGQVWRQRHKATKAISPMVMVESIESQGNLTVVRMRNIETGRISAATIERFTTYPIRYLFVCESMNDLEHLKELEQEA
jgi:hypothetical protein